MSSDPQKNDRSASGFKEKGVMKTRDGRKVVAGLGRRVGICVVTMALSLAALAATATPAALAGVPEWSIYSGAPDTVEAGGGLRFSLAVANTGNAPFTGTFTVTDTLPPGITPNPTEDSSCETVGQSIICGIEENNMQPGGQWSQFFQTEVEPGITGTTGMNVIRVEGNGAGPDLQVEEAITFGPPGPFEIDSFTPSATRAGSPETQAGASPEQLETPFGFLSSPFKVFNVFPIGLKATEHVRNIIIHAPPGVIANLDATPVRCTIAQLVVQPENGANTDCPADSQIGTVRVLGKRLIVSVYNMVTPPGVPAMFGFDFLNVPVLTQAHLRPDDFGFDLDTLNTNSAVPIADVDYTLWGVPSDSSHDSTRGLCFDGQEGNTKNYVPTGVCPSTAPRKAFLRLPTSCSGQPLDWSMEADSYEHPGVYKTRQATTPPQVGCNQLEFTPTLQARPTTNVGDSPAGLEFGLHIPQNEDPSGVAEAELKNLTALLPEGLTVNPASADGLGSCSPQQIGLLTPVGQPKAKFNGDPASCPDSSKLGSVSVYAPAVGHTLPGLAYLAAPHENPFGSLLGLYLAIDDPASGIIVKIPVKIESDPATGRLTTVVEESAPLPFEDFKVELDPGPHASLRTPVACGNYATISDLTPWSAPEGQDAHPSDSFEIARGAGGGACVSSEAAAPAVPSFEAGTLEPKAGAYSPLVLKLTRQDGSQQMTGLDATLPKGLLARLSYSTYCPEAALAAAAAETGQQELAQPSCPASSEVGTVQIATGAGPAPLHVQGRVYVTGPYKGAPLGLAVVTPAVAGPFDLGTVVTRAAVQIDQQTAQVTAVSDPFPHILQGIPLDIRQILVYVNRPNYILNPTSCDPMAVTGSVALLSGQTSAITNPFQVGGCTNLGFKPKLSLRVSGALGRRGHPALTSVVTMPPGGANIASAVVALPPTEILDNNHLKTPCTRVQFAAKSCPPGSVLGSATAVTPLLEQPLTGPVYLMTGFGHTLPDVVADLNGQIDVILDGKVDSTKAGGLRTTFASVPDAPVTKFVLKLKGGKVGLLQNTVPVCKGKPKVAVQFDGQNGKTADQSPALKAACGSSRHRKGHRR